MTLTKEDLTNSIYNRCGLSKNKSTILVESLLELMKSTLESGEDLLISGFGKFYVQNKTKRLGRNPQTGDDMTLRPRKIVRFKWSGRLRNKMSGER